MIHKHKGRVWPSPRLDLLECEDNRTIDNMFYSIEAVWQGFLQVVFFT